MRRAQLVGRHANLRGEGDGPRVTAAAATVSRPDCGHARSLRRAGTGAEKCAADSSRSSRGLTTSSAARDQHPATRPRHPPPRTATRLVQVVNDGLALLHERRAVAAEERGAQQQLLAARSVRSGGGGGGRAGERVNSRSRGAHVPGRVRGAAARRSTDNPSSDQHTRTTTAPPWPARRRPAPPPGAPAAPCPAASTAARTPPAPPGDCGSALRAGGGDGPGRSVVRCARVRDLRFRWCRPRRRGD